MKPTTIVYTSNVLETEAVGATLANRFLEEQPSLPRFIALYGDLGVGKTAFVRGFASVIVPKATVRSPTFALVNEYRGERLSLFHFDMYRIESEEDLMSVGYDDYLTRRGICLVEWSEKIPYALPETYLKVTIEKNDSEQPEQRKITIQSIAEDNI